VAVSNASSKTRQELAEGGGATVVLSQRGGLEGQTGEIHSKTKGERGKKQEKQLTGNPGSIFGRLRRRAVTRTLKTQKGKQKRELGRPQLCGTDYDGGGRKIPGVV